MSATEPTKTKATLTDPVYLRVSKAVELFGIGRTTLYSLISSRKIKSVLLKSKGRTSGIRLVCFESLKAYLDGLAEGGGQS